MNRFLSFADSRMSAALERLGRQAEALDFFDEITLFTEHDLSAEFTSRMGRYLTPSCRGFGYWSWKPWSIHHVLQEMEEGDRLLYLDAGCHINANGTERFREYVNMLDRDSRGMLVFTNGQPEYKWTKGDIFRHFGVSQEDGHITHTQQIAGGHVFLKKNPLTESLIRDWLHFFDEITLFTEHDLSAEFTSRMGRYLTPSCRGFGYWSWKPWSIHHVLQEMEEGDRLLYLDAGCHINANGTERFREYVNMLDRDSRGMLVFTNGQPEYKWTKGDIFRHFGVSQEDGHITHTQQIAGGHVFLKKNPLTESLIRDWLHVFYDHLHLADNTPSASPNLPGFVENRYDQSIFSILCKLRGITTLDGSETYAENWEQLSLFPFQDRRDMGIPRAGKKGWLEKCRQLLLSSKRNGLGIR